MYVGENLDDGKVRDELLRYFVNKLLITGWFAESDVHNGAYDESYNIDGHKVEFGPSGFESFALISTKTCRSRKVWACSIIREKHHQNL